MKPTLALGILLGTLLAGCGEKSGTPAKSSSFTDTASAPADYLKSAAQSQKAAVKAVDTVALNKAIELFFVQEGRFPKDLDEMVEKRLIAKIPPAPAGMKIVYDAKDGLVTVEKE